MDVGDSGVVIRVLSMILTRLIDTNEKPTADQHLITKFQSSYKPEVSIHGYLERIKKYAKCSDCCFVIALIYIDRLIELRNVVITTLNVHRLVITSLMLSAKFFDDLFYNNAFYAKLGGVTALEINALEVDLLSLLNFSLFVTSEQYAKYHGELQSYAGSTSISPTVFTRGLSVSRCAPQWDFESPRQSAYDRPQDVSFLQHECRAASPMISFESYHSSRAPFLHACHDFHDIAMASAQGQGQRPVSAPSGPFVGMQYAPSWVDPNPQHAFNPFQLQASRSESSGLGYVAHTEGCANFSAHSSLSHGMTIPMHTYSADGHVLELSPRHQLHSQMRASAAPVPLPRECPSAELLAPTPVSGLRCHPKGYPYQVSVLDSPCGPFELARTLSARRSSSAMQERVHFVSPTTSCRMDLSSFSSNSMADFQRGVSTNDFAVYSQAAPLHHAPSFSSFSQDDAAHHSQPFFDYGALPHRNNNNNGYVNYAGTEQWPPYSTSSAAHAMNTTTAHRSGYMGANYSHEGGSDGPGRGCSLRDLPRHADVALDHRQSNPSYEFPPPPAQYSDVNGTVASQRRFVFHDAAIDVADTDAILSSMLDPSSAKSYQDRHHQQHQQLPMQSYHTNPSERFATHRDAAPVHCGYQQTAVSHGGVYHNSAAAPPQAPSYVRRHASYDPPSAACVVLASDAKRPAFYASNITSDFKISVGGQ